MKLNHVLETIASNARFTICLDEMLSSQSQDIKEIFVKSDSQLLKDALGNSMILADRTTIFQI